MLCDESIVPLLERAVWENWARPFFHYKGFLLYNEKIEIAFFSVCAIVKNEFTHVNT
jgi:hypothetical protein